MMMMLFWMLQNNDKDKHNRIGNMFFVTMQCLSMPFAKSIMGFNIHRDLFYKESQKKLFRTGNYFFAVIVVELPIYLIFCYIYAPIVMYTTNINMELYHFIRFYITTTAAVVAGQAMGLMVGAAAKNSV